MAETFLCTSCGAENLMSYEFCGACGTKLVRVMQQSAKNCPTCGSPNPADYKFCGTCGVRLGTVCPNCGASVPADSRYCPSCAYLCGDGRHEL